MMNIQDAANLLDISGEITPEIAKLAFRRAAMKFHPDRNPAGLVMMQAINAAYEVLKEHTGLVSSASGYDVMLNDAINSIVTCPNIIIEVCGNWVWLSGDTKSNKEIIKTAGFKYGSVKKMWYFRPDEWKSANRTNNSIDKIREVYGSLKVDTKKAQVIA